MPGYIPIFKIVKGGQDITNRFQDRTTEIKVELAAGNGAQDTCSITLDDRDWLIARPQVDDYLDIYLGYQDIGLELMGTFEIDEVSFIYPPKGIQIHGNAQGNNTLLKAQKVQNFDNKTVQETLDSIGKDTGLTVKVNPSIGNQKVPFKNIDMSPQQFISQLERQYNGVAKVAGNVLSFTTRDSGQTASGESLPIIVLQKEHFADYIVKHTNRSDYSKVVAQYRDPTTNKTMDVEAPTAVKGLPGSAGSNGDMGFKLKNLFNSQVEAMAGAKAMMSALDRNMGEGNFTLAEGDPWIRDQTRIVVQGTRDGVDGSYVADVVTHTYTKNQGLRTAIKGMPPDQGPGSLEALIEANPGSALRPSPGQVTGQVVPKQN